MIDLCRCIVVVPPVFVDDRDDRAFLFPVFVDDRTFLLPSLPLPSLPLPALLFRTFLFPFRPRSESSSSSPSSSPAADCSSFASESTPADEELDDPELLSPRLTLTLSPVSPLVSSIELSLSPALDTDEDPDVDVDVVVDILETPNPNK